MEFILVTVDDFQAEENNSPVCMLSHFSSFRLFATLRTPSLPGSFVNGSIQARALEWAAFLTPGDLPDPGIETASLTSPASAGES